MLRSRALPLAAAVLAPVVVCAVLALARDLLTNNNAALVLVLVVVAVAATGDRAAGLLAAVVSAVAFDFFLTTPYLTLAIDERDDVEAAVLLALIGLAVTEIALWGRRQQARASTQAGYLSGVVTAARLAASGTTPAGDVVELVGRQIRDLLDLDNCRFETGPSDGSRPRLQPDGTITWRGRTVDADREGLPTLDVIELPVTSSGVDRGRYLLTSTSRVRRPDLERREVAGTLADQVAAALAGARPTDGDGERLRSS